MQEKPLNSRSVTQPKKDVSCVILDTAEIRVFEQFIVFVNFDNPFPPQFTTFCIQYMPGGGWKKETILGLIYFSCYPTT